MCIRFRQRQPPATLVVDLQLLAPSALSPAPCPPPICLTHPPHPPPTAHPPPPIHTYTHTIPPGADVIRLAIIQEWRPRRKELADFLDFNLAVRRPLLLPATGILGPSYHLTLKVARRLASASLDEGDTVAAALVLVARASGA